MYSYAKLNKIVSVPPGTLRSIRPESSLPEGLRAEAELQRSRCDQMGALHRPQWHLRDALLTAAPPHGETQTNRWRVGLPENEQNEVIHCLSLSTPLPQICIRWSIHTKTSTKGNQTRNITQNRVGPQS